MTSLKEKGKYFNLNECYMYLDEDVKEAINDYKLFCRIRKKMGNTPLEEIMPDYEYLSNKYDIIIGFPIAIKEDEMFDIIFGVFI